MLLKSRQSLVGEEECVGLRKDRHECVIKLLVSWTEGEIETNNRLRLLSSFEPYRCNIHIQIIFRTCLFLPDVSSSSILKNGSCFIQSSTFGINKDICRQKKWTSTVWHNQWMQRVSRWIFIYIYQINCSLRPMCWFPTFKLFHITFTRQHFAFTAQTEPMKRLRHLGQTLFTNFDVLKVFSFNTNIGGDLIH